MKQLSISFFSSITVKSGIIIFLFFSVIQLNAQTVKIDSLPVKDLMYGPIMDTIQFPVRNLSKDSTLKYQSFIEYKRTQNEMILQGSLSLSNVDTTHYNSFIQYVDTAFLSTAYGNLDKSPLTVATRFTAGNNGFNLSDVGTWFISENDTSGIIRVEIRAGGNSIQDAIIVSQGSAKFQFAKNEINGHLFNIHLDKEVVLYPNEDFYVVFTYPGEIARPQGCAVNDSIASVAGRYWIKTNNQFVDLQQMKGFAHGAWLMYAAEKSPKNIGWLSIIKNASNSIKSHDSIFVKLQLNGLIAGLGSQYADVVILSNDTVNSEVRVPVELRLNEAPYFLDAPTDISIKEGVTSEINITVKDLEGDKFSIAPVMGSKFVQFSVKDSILTLNISPQKGYAGDYTVAYSATDEHNMSRVLKITIHVLPNKAPVFINPPTSITVEETHTLDVQIKAYSPENVPFVISLTDTLAFVGFSSEDSTINLQIYPQAGDAGNYTLHLIAKDTTGLVSELFIPLTILLKNQPPAYIGDGSPIVFSFMDNSKQFDINTYFADPEKDTFTFTVICQDSTIIEVMSDNQTNFVLTPKSVGNTTLDFTLTDAKGAQSQYSIEVTVGQCENPDEIIIQKWNKTLLVNNYSQKYDSAGYQWYRNGMPIKNATRQDYCSEEDTGGLLDFTAEYFVRMIKVNGDTVYTCPYIPVRKITTAKVYPNPVAKGASINIENESTGSGIIQIVDILGHVQKTIQTDQNVLTVQMPTIPGLYLVKVIYGNNKNVFRIKVY